MPGVPATPPELCLIAEPIHPEGERILRAAGIAVRHAAAPDLAAAPQDLADATAVIVRDALPAAAIDAAPRLAVIANHGTGTDAVDVAHATALGIPVVYTPASNVQAVAEHAVMLMLAVARRAVAADRAVRTAEPGYRTRQETLSLHGKTLAVLGFGQTGSRVARMAAGLGMRVLVWSPRTDPQEAARAGAQWLAGLDEALAQADVVSLHRPLRPDTRHTLDARTLALLKPTAIVVNTSRGGLIDEAALAGRLRAGALFGAGLDVFETEPLPPSSPLAGLDNVVLTPHVAGSTQDALFETASQCARQIVDVLAGRRPEWLVRPEVWERRRRAGGTAD